MESQITCVIKIYSKGEPYPTLLINSIYLTVSSLEMQSTQVHAKSTLQVFLLCPN